MEKDPDDERLAGGLPHTGCGRPTGAGVADPGAILDDPQWVEWRGGPAHEFSAASPAFAAIRARTDVPGGPASPVRRSR
ncbi:hypothetical protein ACF061_31430 [Streptomyces sp. NPDC015220]|uniref:hypothetical protein n=1 Tax=Streptomyces sp. NPDC015220 TaxID=3364947 RepID=UPI0036FABE3F